MYRILVIQTAFMGDAVLSIPLLKVIKNKFPESTLVFVCRQGLGNFFKTAKVVDDVIEVDKSNRESLALALRKTREFVPELIISPHRSFRTAFWVRRLRPQLSVGFKSIWSFFGFKKAVSYSQQDHDVLRQLSLMTALGVNLDEIPLSLKSLKVSIPNDPKFDSYSEHVAIAPGSQWETKKWDLAGYVAIAEEVSKAGRSVVILGSRQERGLGEEIAGRIKGAVNLCGETTVVELAQILQQVKFLVCNDSGTMHVATSVGTPVVSIFGPTVPEQGYSPWSDKARVVQDEGLSCRPCGAHGHDRCPIRTHVCMKNVTPAMVMKAVRSLELGI